MSGLSVVRTPEQPGAQSDTSLYLVVFNANLIHQMAMRPLVSLPACQVSNQNTGLVWPAGSSAPRPAAAVSHWTPGSCRQPRSESEWRLVTSRRDCGSNYAVSGRGRAGTPLCDVWAAPCRGDRVQHAPSQAKLHGRLAR